MESVEEVVIETIVWPKSVLRRQTLAHVGTREERDPAFLTCHGACGKKEVKWTTHSAVNSASFKCEDCGNVRRWGLGYSFHNT